MVVCQQCVVVGTAVQYAKINLSNSDDVDEVEEYISVRSLSAAEAMWRILQFDTNWKHPSVECLDIHLPGEPPPLPINAQCIYLAMPIDFLLQVLMF
jgi:hypothetical protein